tara:strand:- start:116 stop:538 length:423 start_codon:yes stop_codon:yes gene_type:complete
MVKIPKNENISNISQTSSVSYEQYLNQALSLISSKISIRVYKLAPKDEYPFFERGKDLRVQLYWNKKSIYEFILEKRFFYQSNRNKEDRRWMRQWADPKIKMIKDAIIKKPKKEAKLKKKMIAKVGSTQQKFEEMKMKTK